MIQCLKSFSLVNLISFTHGLFENIFTAEPDANSNCVFDQLYKWRAFEDGFEEAKTERKPIFFLIYKTLCPACRKLKENCSKSMRFMDLSSRFIMIQLHAEDQAIVSKKNYQPDGKYVPRILFFNPDGEFIREAYNRHPNADKKHKYFYSTSSQVVETMLYVLKKYTQEALPVMYEHNQLSTIENVEVDDEILTPTLY